MPKLSPIVFGEALVDAFAEGAVPGGAPFNVACHLAALGFAPLMITRLGEDAAGATLRTAAERSGLALATAQHDTTTASVIVREHAGEHVFEIPADQAFDRIDAVQAMAAAAASVIDGERWIYFGTLALRGATSRGALSSLRQGMPHRAFLDLNWRAGGPSPAAILDLLHQVDVLKVNTQELERLLGWLGLAPTAVDPSVGTQHDAMAALCAHTGIRLLLVSQGAAGAAVWDRRGCCIARSAAPPVPQLVDSVGAGDAFSAMMLAGLMCRVPIGRMLGQAVAFASLSCGWRGALPPHPALYHSWQGTLAAGERDEPAAALE